MKKEPVSKNVKNSYFAVFFYYFDKINKCFDNNLKKTHCNYLTLILLCNIVTTMGHIGVFSDYILFPKAKSPASPSPGMI